MSNDEVPIFVISERHPDKKLSRAYKDSPSIETYLQLRKANPNKEIEIAITGGIDWLFANEQLVKAEGIDPQIVAGALDADHQSISKLSLSLLQRLLDREKLEQAGKTHIASRGEGISDVLVNYLIAMMLDALSWTNELEIPRDLIVLARHQLLGSERTMFDKKLESKHIRQAVISIAAQFLERNEPVSMRQVAVALNKDVSTISRMFPNNSMKDEAERFLDGLRSIAKSETPFADMAKRHQNSDQD
jgi:hypothetical protein